MNIQIKVQGSIIVKQVIYKIIPYSKAKKIIENKLFEVYAIDYNDNSIISKCNDIHDLETKRLESVDVAIMVGEIYIK